VSRRAFVVVLDAVGAGELPDSPDYGDAGADTLVHLDEAVAGLRLPVLGRLGLGHIRPLRGVPPSASPALHGRLAPLGPGKDSTTGHWELMGVITPHPLPTYPDGFPRDVVDRVQDATGLRFCGNRPADGLAVLDELGEHHLRTGEVILYTSADSVLQLAAHDGVLAEEDLRAACAAARRVMTGEHAVGRVIARPFTGEPGDFRRTTGRKDFALPPPARSYLDAVQEAGVPVHAVGKVRDLFAGVGIDEAHAGATNAVALEQTGRLIRELDHGLVFTNLIETDQLYGHRHDAEGFHGALQRIDAAVASWLPVLGEEDLLVLTADHGVDPTMPHHDHTREHVPLLARFGGASGRRHDGNFSDVGASALRWLTGRDEPELPGRSFLDGP
jgi:phosphopentomutase